MDTLGMEIDRQLFIICRLCLDDSGTYQIVPSVQEQINYCFGIIVKHFDGLPQLVCKKCKLLLIEFSTNKKKVIENQVTLRKKLEDKLDKDNVPGPSADSGADLINSNQKSESDESTTSQEQMKVRTNRKKINRLRSTSSSDSSRSTIATIKKRRDFSNKKKLSRDWKKKYLTNFTCRFCSKTYSNKSNVYRHYRKNHDHIKANYSNILDFKCMVKIEKLDNKPNFTGLTNTVVLNKDKIVKDVGHRSHYIVYESRDKKMDFDTENISKNIDSDSSDEVFTSKNKRKKFRLESRSSTDTVLIGDNNVDAFDENDKIKLENPITKVNENKLFEQKDTICIDSSDSDMEITPVKSKSVDDKTKPIKNIDAKEVGEKIVKEIVSICRKKYEARRKLQLYNNQRNNQKEAQLKHKILSIGRKIITRKGFNNCTGLLRYLEHKNLNVVWERTSEMQALTSKEANFVRMLIMNRKQNTINDDAGWIDIDAEQTDEYYKILERVSPVTTLTNSDASLQKVQSPPVSLQPQLVKQSYVRQDSSLLKLLQFGQMEMQKKNIAKPTPKVKLPQMQQPQMQQPQIQQPQMQQPQMQQPQILQTQMQQPQMQQPQILQPQMQQLQIQQPQIQQPQIQQPQMQQAQVMDQAVLYANIVDDANTKKLLNPFPVANPKQLPKKMHLNDTKASLTINKQSVSNETVLVNVNFGEQINESNIVMPVITSTSSLAGLKTSKRNNKDVNDSNNTDKPAPRIKVKPASELMKPTKMMPMSVSQPGNIWGCTQVQNEPFNNENNIIIPNNLVSQIQNQSVPHSSMVLSNRNVLPIERVTSEGTTNNSDYVILDTVDFPNTKTNSPFKYVRNLLLLHGLSLTEVNAHLTPEFDCLIKFKLQFKQENKNLTLSLSLHCSDNTFCFSVKDSNQINIDIAKMPAYWQWEILKVFQGDVTAKIMNNAEKTGHFLKTKTFVCLLKSINQK